MLDEKTISALELVQDGLPTVRLCFGITWFMAEPLSAFGDQALAAYERYRALAGVEGMRQYATETMTKHRPTTKRALSIVPSWFSPEAPPTDSHGIEFSNAEPFNAAPSTRLAILGRETYGGERLDVATIIRYAFPARQAVERQDELLALTREMCDLLPFRSGQAGYAFECSRYFPRVAGEHAWAKSMRHPGIDIHADSTDQSAVRLDGVRGVGWLTMLDNGFVQALGGTPRFERCETTAVKNGVLIKAGGAPEIGDVNRGDTLPAYREAFAFVEPLARRVAERSPWLKLTHDNDERTRRWYMRLADG